MIAARIGITKPRMEINEKQLRAKKYAPQTGDHLWKFDKGIWTEDSTQVISKTL